MQFQQRRQQIFQREPDISSQCHLIEQHFTFIKTALNLQHLENPWVEHTIQDLEWTKFQIQIQIDIQTICIYEDWHEKKNIETQRIFKNISKNTKVYFELHKKKHRSFGAFWLW